MAADRYLPLQLSTIMANEGSQSSEEHSSLHSPVFDGVSFARQNQFRYPDQLDIRVQTGGDILATHFSDYSSSLISPQEPPSIHTTLQVPRSNIFPPHEYPAIPRNHQEYFAPAHPSVNPQPSHPLGEHIFDYGRQAVQPLPGGPLDSQSHDPTYTRLNASMVASIPPEPSPPIPSSAPSMEPSTSNPSRRDRKDTSAVVIACRQWYVAFFRDQRMKNLMELSDSRGRKIRCDSTRPVCNNCVRRSNTCEYDTVPKRRGPDKRPGTRQRSCKKRPTADSGSLAAAEPPAKRKKVDTGSVTTQGQLLSKENMAGPEPARRRSQDFPQANDLRIATEVLPVKEESQSPITQRYISYGYNASLPKSAFPRPIDTNIPQPSVQRTHKKFPPPSSPIAESIHRDWWNRFLLTSGYSLSDLEIHTRYLFSDTLHSLEFLNVDYFVQTLHSPERRHTIQPAFILAVLALSTLMKSSTIENGEKGRRDALQFRDAAHQALQTAMSSEWVDAAVAEAALILCLFESSAHPQYSPSRYWSSLALLSDIIRSQSLTTIDNDDADVCRYTPQVVPSVQLAPNQALSKRCTCIPSDAQQPPDPHSTWSYPLPWDPSWTDIQVRDEECRRVCWCALGIVAHYTVQVAALDDQLLSELNIESELSEELWICDPANYAILFPAEAIDRALPLYRSVDSPSPKESVYALYCRSMLLWVFCHYRLGRCDDEQLKAEYAQEAMGESQFIQESLDFHVCNLDTGLIYLTREYISNTRVIIGRCLRSFHGLTGPSNRLVSKRQAQDWVNSQEQVVKRVTLSIQRTTDPHGHQLTRRPYQVTWYSNQLATCLMLWKHDHSNLAALQLAKSMVVIVDVLNYLWPCSYEQALCDDLRNKLIKACRMIGLDPPHAAEYSVPAIFRAR
ncbi:hypothetical protein V5O48_001481 [Marasmius crinis-equi]|uniref:Zn(2)-C6 fungal-type domain-containing protein n=1 Tax=Marasmius crinis-equi TaxID=585013 RepID=A0ABR3FYF5_9AGAR